MFSPGWPEMIIFGVIALLLFGKRLPEVARSLGQGFVEFKKGMTNIETDMRTAVHSDPASTQTIENSNRIEEDLKPSSEKFETETEAEPGSDEVAEEHQEEN